MRFFPYLLPIAILAGAAVISCGIGDLVNPPIPPAGLEAHETHASASLLGQFRTSASSMLWLRTDLYLHNGVEMRPLTDQEVSEGKKGVGGAKDGHEAIVNDDAIVTVVPSAQQDFRGVFGDVERAVNAYRDMRGHEHRDPVQALPLFRLMTWLDPQFVTAWVTGATIIARDRSSEGTTRALSFLAEGEVPCGVGLRRMLESGVSATQITFTSDGQGSLPAFDAAGRLLRLDIGRVTSLFGRVREAVLEEGVPLETALQVVTTNPARILKLRGKGRLAPGHDADLVLLEPTTLDIRGVMAKGAWLMRDGQLLKHGVFEP